ncbi:hypothetical protein [Xanthomonas citri]|uniref:hypothetical protein n=1 Tax=Xanthomonas citri TaxID=346 RepID=UPI00193125C1|nr:hypothetical protein [Xanthomonas citri]QRD62610.1 hypothetical protein H8Z74_23235 [Xanthomonas citri pv. citri]QRD67144.1 hypothetical protein H8Z73_22210 [Xanthomonas citri pv. citri]
MIQIDFKDYPDNVHDGVLWRAPPEALKAVPQLYDRAASSLYMLFQSGGSEIILPDGISGGLHVAAHFRAALTEFVGVEEAMKNAGFAYRIQNSKSPLLHFMRLLRNYQIHVGTQPIAQKQWQFKIGDMKGTVTMAIIDNLHVDDFMELRAIKDRRDYTRDDVKRMILGFQAYQGRLGAYELLRRGVTRLISEVAAQIER